MPITPRLIREARAFLQKRNIGTSEIPPRTFAEASAQMQKSFKETLRLLARLMMQGQGMGQAEESFRRFGKNKED